MIIGETAPECESRNEIVQREHNRVYILVVGTAAEKAKRPSRNADDPPAGGIDGTFAA
jgi:hypothetical protein